MSKVAKVIIRTSLSCAFVGVAGFIAYYVFWAINTATAWAMDKIDWVWEYVKTNLVTAIVIIVLFGIGSWILDISSNKLKELYSKICDKFR